MRAWRLLLVSIATLHLVLVGWISVVKSPVLDELPHLVAGISHWEFGDFSLYRVNPPLVRMIAAVPAVVQDVEVNWRGDWPLSPDARPEFPLGRQLGRDLGSRVFLTTTVARWACLPLMGVGAFVCWRWASRLYGRNSGLIALLLWSFSPNLLAWGGTICPDAAAAALGLVAGYTFWRWLEQPGAGSAVLAGIGLTLAVWTKSTWLLLFGLWPALWCGWRIARRGEAEPCPSVAGVAGILLIGLYGLNAGYGFAGTGTRLGDFEFISQSLSGSDRPGVTGNRFTGTRLPGVPVPLPADFVQGLDIQRGDFERGKISYLRGEQQQGGWWWYYLYAAGVKTPLGTLLLGLLAVVLLLAGPQGAGRWRQGEWVVLLPAVCVFVLVSSQTGFNRYLRYVLPAVPFLFVWISRVGSLFDRTEPRRGLSVARVAVMLLLCWSTVSSLRVWPHSTSYFNELAGGPAGGHRHLLDANIDWGQDLLELREWTLQHPEARPLYVSTFGWVEPEQAGIDAEPVPHLLLDRAGRIVDGAIDEVSPGWSAVSVNHVMGYRHYENEKPTRAWLAEFPCVGRAGYGFRIYHLDQAAIDAFVRSRPSGPVAPWR